MHLFLSLTVNFNGKYTCTTENYFDTSHLQNRALVVSVPDFVFKNFWLTYPMVQILKFVRTKLV